MVSLSLMLCVGLILPLQAKAELMEQGALTNSPPTLFQPFTLFDPDFVYLEKGGGYISEMSDGKVNFWGETYGTVRVNEIGIQLTLQRWTGSEWVSILAASATTDENSAHVYESVIASNVAKGYYYRTKSQHWIVKGNTYEGGTRYSPSILISL